MLCMAIYYIYYDPTHQYCSASLSLPVVSSVPEWQLEYLGMFVVIAIFEIIMIV
jgi:hypothetical protein